MALIVLKDEDKWLKALKKAQKWQKKEETTLLIGEEAVNTCIKCEPELFKHLHQFILDGGKVLVCSCSLQKRGIPFSRPPDILERIKDYQDKIKESKKKGEKIILL